MTTIRVPSVLVAKALAGVITAEGFCNAVAKQAAAEAATSILLAAEASAFIGETLALEKPVTLRTPHGLRKGTRRWTATITFDGNVSEKVVAGMKILADQKAAAQAEKSARANKPAPAPATPKAAKASAPAYAADAFVVSSWASFNTLLALAAGSKKALEKVTAEAVKRGASQVVLPEQAAETLRASGALSGVVVIATGPLPKKPLADMTAKVEAAQAQYAQQKQRKPNGTGFRAGGRGIGAPGKTARTGGKAAADAKKAERRARDQALRSQMRGDSNKKG